MASVEKKYSHLHYPSIADGQIAEISLEQVHPLSVASLFFLGGRLQVKGLSLRLVFKTILMKQNS